MGLEPNGPVDRLPFTELRDALRSGERPRGLDEALDWISTMVALRSRPRVRNPERLESATNSVLLTLLIMMRQPVVEGALGKVDDYESLIAYLIVAVLRRTWEKEKRLARNESIPEGLDLPARAPTPLQEAESAEIERLTYEITEQVIRRGEDEGERGIIALLIEKKIYGLKISNAEIGARHGVSESTVRRVRDWVYELLGEMFSWMNRATCHTVFLSDNQHSRH